VQAPPLRSISVLERARFFYTALLLPGTQGEDSIL
jgi:hypothetical protein